MPKHVTAEALRAVTKGLDYLATQQSADGSWISGGGQAYPVAMAGLAGTAFLAHGNSPTRGKYSRTVQGAVEFLVRCATPTGLITGPGQDNGIPMHGHGFALMFLASVYGMVTKESLRRQVAETVRKAVALTSQGQSSQGGWTYIPGAGDEGSVTVTQVQALRAAQNAGFLVPKAVIEEAGRYLEKCRTPEGGIQYSLRFGGDLDSRSRRRPWPRSTTPASLIARSPPIASNTFGVSSGPSKVGTRGCIRSTVICTPHRDSTWRATSIGTTTFLPPAIN